MDEQTLRTMDIITATIHDPDLAKTLKKEGIYSVIDALSNDGCAKDVERDSTDMGFWNEYAYRGDGCI